MLSRDTHLRELDWGAVVLRGLLDLWRAVVLRWGTVVLTRRLREAQHGGARHQQEKESGAVNKKAMLTYSCKKIILR